MTWLQDFLDTAAANNLRVTPNCTTCAGHAFDARLMYATRRAAGVDFTARGWTERTLTFLANGLAELPHIAPRDEGAVRWIILRLNRFYGDDAFARDLAQGLKVSAAGAVLRAMQVHHAAQQERRRVHADRNDPVAVETRREARRAAGQERDAERRKQKKARDLARLAQQQLEATRDDEEQWSFLFRTPGSTSLAYCAYSVTEDEAFDGELEGLDLPWEQARIDHVAGGGVELTSDELHQWRRAKCRLMSRGSDFASIAWVVPLQPRDLIEGYALFLSETDDPEASPILEGVFPTAEAATDALRKHGEVAQDQASPSARLDQAGRGEWFSPDGLRGRNHLAESRTEAHSKGHPRMPLRVVTWNCGGGFAKLGEKARRMQDLGADILVIQEVLENYRDALGPPYESVWEGEAGQKGMLVAAKPPWRLECVHRSTPALHLLLVEARTEAEAERISIICVWALKDPTRKNPEYVHILRDGLDQLLPLARTANMIVTGDFNASPKIDPKLSSKAHFGWIAARLHANGLRSLWHEKHGEEFGRELSPTHYHGWRQERPFHIDYMFASRSLKERLRSLTIGSFEEWCIAGRGSDHMPLIADFAAVDP